MEPAVDNVPVRAYLPFDGIGSGRHAEFDLQAVCRSQTRRQILCIYDGYARALCPIGHGDGEEKALAYQFAGESSTPLRAAGQWKCLRLSKVGRAELRDGPWHAAARHEQPQSCVKEVDLDVNPESPYRPRRRIV